MLPGIRCCRSITPTTTTTTTGLVWGRSRYSRTCVCVVVVVVIVDMVGRGRRWGCSGGARGVVLEKGGAGVALVES